MPEVIEEYVSILVSRNTYRRLQKQAELIEPSIEYPTSDMVISRMLQNLDFLKDGDMAMTFDFIEHAFDIIPIEKLKKQDVEAK